MAIESRLYEFADEGDVSSSVQPLLHCSGDWLLGSTPELPELGTAVTVKAWYSAATFY